MRLWTRSSLTMSSMDCGAQIWVAYPKCGLTRAGYSVPLTSVLSMNLVFLFKYKFVYLFVPCQILTNPYAHIFFCNISQVRCCWVCKRIRSALFSFLCAAPYTLSFVKRRPDDWDQVTSLPRSFWREETPLKFLISLNIFVSSANIITRLLELMTSGRSLKYKRKSRLVQR